MGRSRVSLVFGAVVRAKLGSVKSIYELQSDCRVCFVQLIHDQFVTLDDRTGRV